MVKTYHVKQYLQSGIEDNINNCEDTITSEYSNETSNSFEVEFTDYSMDGVKSKYRITIESIDEEVYTYKDELYKRLKTIFPNLHQLKIKRIAEDIMKNESNNPSILHDKGGKRVIVESWNNEFNSHNM